MPLLLLAFSSLPYGWYSRAYLSGTCAQRPWRPESCRVISHLDGFVDALEGEVEEEGFPGVRLPLDDLHGLPAEQAGAVLALALVRHRLVVTEIVAEELLGAVTGDPAPVDML